ncbi:phosphoglycerate mutase family protein [Aquimonas sp.]|jgi:broad specificity phosphatase PhoE|uniref:phosphoglycerate mutase family protein n=1 Tax=Aquimonas sp. TaxID=1872588 RepID=UPI0037BEA274
MRGLATAVFIAGITAAGIAVSGAAPAWPSTAAALLQPAASGELVVVVVRHAEKATDDARDPSLSAAGADRAQALAKRLAGLPLAAAYATPFKRTQLSAAPAADAAGIAVTVREFVSRNPDEDAAALREQLLHDHRGEVVLVVGHSNTVPAIVEALAGSEAEPMAEAEFDRLSVVRLRADGSALLGVERY